MDEATGLAVEAFLEHHGVKGMKWGVHRAKVRERNQAIGDARARQASREHQIDDHIARANLAKTDKGREAAVKAIQKLVEEDRDSGDAKMAAKLTSGEKAANAVLIGALGASIAIQFIGSSR